MFFNGWDVALMVTLMIAWQVLMKPVFSAWMLRNSQSISKTSIAVKIFRYLAEKSRILSW